MLPLLIVMQVAIVAMFSLTTIPFEISLALLAGYAVFDAGLIVYERRSGPILNPMHRLAIIGAQWCLVVLVLLGRGLRFYLTGE